MKQIYSFPILFLLCLLACAPSAESTTSSANPSGIDQATEVKIAFREGEKFSITDPTGLQYCKGLITNEESPEYKCGYTGEISYVQGETELLRAEFNLDKNCQHIVYMQGEEVVSRKMSKDGLRFLQGLQKPEVTPEMDIDPNNTQEVSDTEISELTWILGDWLRSEGVGIVSVESWSQTGDDRLEGLAYTLNKTDTAYTEKLEIIKEGEAIYYVPTLIGKQGPVRFKMTAKGKTSATFENPEHDYPQTIAYKVTEDTILLARISGVRVGPDGKKESGFKDFYMNKVR